MSDYNINSLQRAEQQNLSRTNSTPSSVTTSGHTFSKVITNPKVLFVAALVASVFAGTVTAMLLIGAAPISPLVAGGVGLILGTTMLAKSTYDIFSKSTDREPPEIQDLREVQDRHRGKREDYGNLTFRDRHGPVGDRHPEY